jgi:arylsulfatase
MTDMDTINRRRFLCASAISSIAITLGSAKPLIVAQETVKQNHKSQKPNILWICTDQQRYDTIHSLGNKHIRTPNLDKLVETGVAFTHAYCQSQVCTPSRASFLTGMYPDAIRACMNGNDYWGGGAPLITKTLADNGYDCGLSGKLHLSSFHKRIEKRPDDGYRAFHWSHDPQDNWPSGHGYIDWLEEQGFSYNKLIRKHGSIPGELHQTTWCTNMAIDFIRENQKKPWLFSLNCFAPHSLSGKMYPPKDYVKRFDVDSLPGPHFRDSDLKAQKKLKKVNFQTKPTKYGTKEAKLYQAEYWALIEHIDENVGRLIDALQESAQRDNTIVIFTSDHGEALGDHGLRRKGCRFFDGLVRVPLIISWPGRFKKGIKSDALVELTDIVPTLLEATGLPVPNKMHGKSLMGILEGEADPHNHRDFVRSVYYNALHGTESYATMLRTRKYKIVNYHGHDTGELFDLEKDPYEFENLWDDPAHADVRFDLMRKSFDALAFAVDTGPPRVGEK